MDETLQGRFHQPGTLTVARLKTVLVLAGLLVPSFSTSAQVALPTVAEVAAYAGPDRAERLIAGAKREGTLTLYTSAAVDDMAVPAAAFEKKYGVKLRVWRASSEHIVQRSVTEARGGRYDADVFETGGAAMEALHREKLLQQVKVPGLAALNPAAFTPHGEWTGTRFNVFVAAVNTRLVAREEFPKSYDDLLDPRWKGRLGIEAEDSDWFGAVIGQLGEARGLKLFRDIVAANGISVRKGHTLLANLVVSGEVPLALTIYSFRAEQMKKNGAPIDWFAIPPAIARFEGAGVARRAPHPHAAVLFHEFLLTEAQDLLRAREILTARQDAKQLPGGATITFLDAAKNLDESPKWSKYYRDVILTQAR